MAVVTYSPVEGEMEVDTYGLFVSLESYLILEKLVETLKEQVDTQKRLFARYKELEKNTDARDGGGE